MSAPRAAPGRIFEAPQSVDDAFWAAPATPLRRAPFQVLFAGRLEREKGVEVLLRAWGAAGLEPDEAALVLVGDGPLAHEAGRGTARLEGPRPAAEVRDFYAGSDVVVVPSIPTRAFREPWGLVVNEAFDRGVPVIASTAVGAAAGGLVRHEETGLVVPAGNPSALAAALRRLHGDPALRGRLGAAAREAVKAHSHAAWAAGMSRALAAAGAGAPEGRC